MEKEKETKNKKKRLFDFLKRNKSLLFKIGFIVVAIFMITTTINKFRGDMAKNTVKAGYEEITAVPGLSFQIEKVALDASTAVMEISKKVDFATNQTYMYKNGKDTYLLFNMNNFIVVAKKGTNFNLAEESVTESLEKNSLNGIWFELEGKESSVKKERNRYEMSVSAQVVITNDIYNDFIGKLIVFDEEETEWAFFIGSPSKKTPFYESELEIILTSLKRSDNENMILDSYEVDMNSGSFASAEKVDKEQLKEDGEYTPAAKDEDITPPPGPSEEVTPPTEEDESVDIPNATEPSTEKEPEKESSEPESSEPSKEPEVEEEIDIPIIVLPDEEPEIVTPPSSEEVEEPNPEETKEPNIEEPTQSTDDTKEEKDDEVFFDNNQTEIVKEETKAYTSSIYAMLNVGDTGYMDIVDDYRKTGIYSGAYIKVNKVLDSKETNAVIEEYIKSGKAYYSEMKAPDGCHFEAVVYDVQYTTEHDLYTNIKLLGIDGEYLRFRGIKYSDKTYDILSETKEDGWHKGNVCFYLVPNGCKEYVLKCGDGTSELYGFGAFYHIEVK